MLGVDAALASPWTVVESCDADALFAGRPWWGFLPAARLRFRTAHTHTNPSRHPCVANLGCDDRSPHRRACGGVPRASAVPARASHHRLTHRATRCHSVPRPHPAAPPAAARDSQMTFTVPKPFAWDPTFDVGNVLFNEQVGRPRARDFSVRPVEDGDPRLPDPAAPRSAQHQKLFVMIADLAVHQADKSKLTVRGRGLHSLGAVHPDTTRRDGPRPANPRVPPRRRCSTTRCDARGRVGRGCPAASHAASPLPHDLQSSRARVYPRAQVAHFHAEEDAFASHHYADAVHHKQIHDKVWSGRGGRTAMLVPRCGGTSICLFGATRHELATRSGNGAAPCWRVTLQSLSLPLSLSHCDSLGLSSSRAPPQFVADAVEATKAGVNDGVITFLENWCVAERCVDCVVPRCILRDPARRTSCAPLALPRPRATAVAGSSSTSRVSCRRRPLALAVDGPPPRSGARPH